ncbi:MAG TPA: NAD-dependent epimerase/dehydratase family protein [Puia sp.]|jgi:nucleoside-diphosphate-sugar epimerase
MKILIIGGTGNISRWLTHSLALDGHDITLCNRGNAPLAFPGRVRLLKGDRTDRAGFRRNMAEAGCFDCVIDMVGFEMEDAQEAIAIFGGRTGQFIFCSTVDVYSKQQLHYPVPLDQPIHASAGFPYAYKKMLMEKAFLAAHAGERFPITIIRPAATYSEGISPLLTSFGRQLYHLSRLRRRLPVILHGDGSSIWVETHASDVAMAFASAAGNPSTIGKCYNVTGDEWMTWRSMHIIVAEELGAPAPDFVCIPSTTLGKLAPEESAWCLMNFQYNNIFDNSAAKQDLGYKYAVGYRDGVRRCLKALPMDADMETPPFYEMILRQIIK